MLVLLLLVLGFSVPYVLHQKLCTGSLMLASELKLPHQYIERKKMKHMAKQL